VRALFGYQSLFANRSFRHALVFSGRMFSEVILLSAAYAFEQATKNVLSLSQKVVVIPDCDLKFCK
jgi:hypothetical protein